MGLNAIIDLLLNSAQFDSSLDKSEKRIKGFAREAEKAGKIAGKIGQGLSVANVAGLEKLASGSKTARAALEGLTGAMLLLGTVPIPIAIGVAAAGALATFVLRGDDATKTAEELAQRLDRLTMSALDLAAAPLRADAAAAQGEIDKIREQVADRRKELALLAASGQDMAASPLAEQLQREIAELEKEIPKWAARYKGALAKISEIKREALTSSGTGGKSIAERAAEDASRAQEKMTADQEREAAKRIAIAEREALAATRAAEKAAEQRAEFDAGWDQALLDMGDSWDKDFKNRTESMSVYADQAARNMESAFANFLFDPFANGLDGMLKGFVQVIQRMIAEMAAAQIFEGLGLRGEGNKLTGLLGSLFGGSHAAGGTIPAGKIGLVGEQGPELAYAGSSPLHITPNHALGRGGATINIGPTNIDARGASPEMLAPLLAAVDARDRKLKSDIVTLIKRGYIPA